MGLYVASRVEAREGWGGALLYLLFCRASGCPVGRVRYGTRPPAFPRCGTRVTIPVVFFEFLSRCGWRES